MKIRQKITSPPTQTGWNSLKVGQKILLGYGAALGIATAGTSAGLIIGESSQNQVLEREEYVRKEIQILHRLQTGILQIDRHQQKILSLNKAEVFAQ